MGYRKICLTKTVEETLSYSLLHSEEPQRGGMIE